MDASKYSLAEHLEELRKRLVYCLLFFAVFSALAWRLVPVIINFISRPVGQLVFIHPTEAFFTYLKVSLWSGFFLSLPFIVYHVWKFIEKGLLPREKNYTILFAPASFFLFLLGAGFGLFLAIPLAVKFLVGFGEGWAQPMLSLNNYISFIGWLTVVFGAAFELPLIILFLAKLKIVNHHSLSLYRRQAILLIFIAAAILTPTPDIFTQLLLAVPLMVLYELSVFLSRWA